MLTNSNTLHAHAYLVLFNQTTYPSYSRLGGIHTEEHLRNCCSNFYTDLCTACCPTNNRKAQKVKISQGSDTRGYTQVNPPLGGFTQPNPTKKPPET